MKQILLLLAAMLFCCSADNEVIAQTTMDKIYITIGGQTQSVTLENNTTAKALAEKLQQASVTVTLNSSGGFEIWGALGFSLPESDQQITAQPGDVILYNGSNICLFYGSNSWSYTRIGKIDGLSENDLRTFLKAGENNIGVTLSLISGTTAIGDLTPHSAEGRLQGGNPSPKGEGNIYTLNGVKVKYPSKGLYIKNGNKVIL